ncbi:unnamed protein product [Porites evermanni]|uniref:Uncharacterized protein n=1 Tax=Porites evermanni TaxID=104178 RepID=A0ABN8M508_9CNID|nr:unnamed protein product [Porites evermanni]
MATNDIKIVLGAPLGKESKSPPLGGMETKYYPFNITSILRNDSFSPNRGHFRSANQHQATVPRSPAATMSLAERLAAEANAAVNERND